MLRSLYSAADIVRNTAITAASPQRRRLNRLQLGNFDYFFSKNLPSQIGKIFEKFGCGNFSVLLFPQKTEKKVSPPLRKVFGYIVFEICRRCGKKRRPQNAAERILENCYVGSSELSKTAADSAAIKNPQPHRMRLRIPTKIPWK